MVDYFDHELCKECGGKCCQQQPGNAWPEDFADPMEDSLRIAFSSGMWAVDWWEGDVNEEDDNRNKSLYVRPAIDGEEGRIFHPGWGGICCLLGPDGCSLSDEGRPRTCRALKPIPAEHRTVSGCHIDDADGKTASIRAWRQHEELLYRVAKEFDESRDKNETFEEFVFSTSPSDIADGIGGIFDFIHKEIGG